MLRLMDELREPTFLLLCALADGPKHGYAIRLDVRQASDGRVEMRTGTLYTALDRLSTDGLIERSGDERVAGRVRYYYRLTEHGGACLAAAAEHRAQHATLARTRLNRVFASAAAALACTVEYARRVRW